MAFLTWWSAHFAAKRWRVFPTAIGLNPPSFFSKAKREAPKKEGQADAAVLPINVKLTKVVRDLGNGGPPSSAE